MAAPTIKICVMCIGVIRQKCYRNLNSETSVTQWGHILNELKINHDGFVCHQCSHKMNRICKLTEDSKTKIKEIMREKEQLINCLKGMPGVKVQQRPDKVVTPKEEQPSKQTLPLQILRDDTAAFLRQTTIIHDNTDIQEAETKLKTYKTVILTGQNERLIMAAAMALSKSFLQDQILVLINPSDVKYISREVSLVIVRNFAGKYKFDASHAQNWLMEFNMLQSLIKEWQLNLIIMSIIDNLQECIQQYGRHNLLQQIVTIPDKTVVVKEEPTEGNDIPLDKGPNAFNPNENGISAVGPGPDSLQTLTAKLDFHIDNCCISGKTCMCVISNRYIAYTCDGGIFLVDLVNQEVKPKYKMCDATDIAAVSSDRIVVTCPCKNTINILAVSDTGSLFLAGQMYVSDIRGPIAYDSVRDVLLVATHPDGTEDADPMSLHFIDIRTIGKFGKVIDSFRIFRNYQFIQFTICQHRDLLYVTDTGFETVTTVSLDFENPRVIAHHEKNRGILDLAVDKYGSVFVCVDGKVNQKFLESGVTYKLLEDHELSKTSVCIAYCRHKNVVYVGYREGVIKAFKLH